MLEMLIGLYEVEVQKINFLEEPSQCHLKYF